jgi:hypothetical protein
MNDRFQYENFAVSVNLTATNNIKIRLIVYPISSTNIRKFSISYLAI